MLRSQQKDSRAAAGAGGHSSGRTADHSGFRPDRRALAVLTARLLAVVCVALVLGPPPATSGQAEAVPFEQAMKAAYAYNFVKLVTWPESPMSRTPTFYICVLDDDYLADALDSIVRDKRLKGQSLAVGRFWSIDQVVPCAVLFVGRGAAGRLPQILQQLRGWPVLTMSDAEGFTDQGGAIGLFLEDNRVRFEISVSAVRTAGLQVSSKLLRLSRPAVGGPRAAGASGLGRER
jgi:hypothetical protein